MNSETSNGLHVIDRPVTSLVNSLALRIPYCWDQEIRSLPATVGSRQPNCLG